MQFLTRARLQGLQPVTLRHISSMHSGWKLSALQNRSDAQSNPAQPSAILAADLAASISAPSSTYCRLHPPSQTSRNSASAGEPSALHIQGYSVVLATFVVCPAQSLGSFMFGLAWLVLG